MFCPNGSELEIVEPGEIAEVRVAHLDPDVVAMRAGEVPLWMQNRMRERPELYVRTARLDPETLALALESVR